uniref:Uncharacterized protein n=1 Tax=Anguilla anguilla TaxID=7936 RepID=A0A0E9SS46_ANGAN
MCNRSVNLTQEITGGVKASRTAQTFLMFLKMSQLTICVFNP